ncbi:uncharacterized protein [Maniola hyperantus]|uniref:uncharacterized protein isoform X1 n=1 Tax=Aphantopus hyperantus TaxID=2795564 RepID=UPI00156816F5|nr:uncharacterized protein LOC117991188 [Maniola hyperantus]
MDKNEYETYEYLPTNYVNETDTSQLLVVQEDGTFLCFDRPIQYVNQVDDRKDVLEGVQGCDVYNVVPQQLYIHGDNSSELISVPDQFILPDEENNSYANNYLLQDDENSKEVPMEQDEVVQYKEVTTNIEESGINDIDTESAADKNTGDCTEITLNDEQYQLLEQKGWILLESSDKTFLLDSSGLHDITADEKLTLKLKCELQENVEEEGVTCSIKVDEIQNKPTEIKLENIQPAVENIADMAGYIIEEEGIIEEQEPEENPNFSNNQQGTLKTITEEIIEDGCADVADIMTPIEAEHDYVKLNSVKDSYVKKQSDTIKIKTKFLFKNVPPEIVLGKFNGKKLIARVVKTDRPVRKLGRNTQDTQMATTEQPGFAGLDDNKFEDLIREAVRGTIECGVKDVTAAEIVVGQLSRVPAFRPAVMERGLIITKVIVQEHETGNLYSESNPSLVTGRAIRERDNFNNCRFRFIPEMLRKLAYTEEYQNDDDYDGESNHYNFLHIHIRETKSIDGIIRISITLNKRHIPLNLFTDNNAKLPNTIYACSSCASVYNTEEGLQLHHETECITTETENTLTIDADENSYTIINLSKGNKQYACNMCNIVYTKLDDCQEHIKTHFKEEPVSDSGRTSKQIVHTEIKKTLSLYRCKMCNRAFLDACALSKHIVAKHIQHLNVN